MSDAPDARQRAAQAIIAAGEEARLAAADPAWMQRRRHGDPTAVPALLERACHRLGLAPAEVSAAIAGDPALGRLLADTIERAVTDAQAERREGARLRGVLLIGLPIAAAICIGAWWAYRSYQDDPEVKRRAAQRAAQEAAGTAPGR